MTNTKPWLWLLVASLALNVFLGVSVGTHFFRGPKGPQPRPDGLLREMAEALPEADSRILRDAIESHRSAFSEDDPKARFDQMRKILSTDPFDPEGFARVSSEMRASHEKHAQAINDVLMDAVPKMSPEGRKALANRPPPPRPR